MQLARDTKNALGVGACRKGLCFILVQQTKVAHQFVAGYYSEERKSGDLMEWRETCGRRVTSVLEKRHFMNKVLLQSADRSIDEFQHFADTFVEREAALILIRQLNRLVKAVQRHRGISLTMLAGNTDYRSEFNKLQTELERRLAMLEVFAAANQLLSQRDKQDLANAWATIRNDWEDDNLNDNFELHSHLIQQLLLMIEKLSDIVGLPLSEKGECKDNDNDSCANRHAFLRLVCTTLPTIIEDIARVRGTVSYLVAVGKRHDLDESKVRFWVQNVSLSKERLRSEVSELAASGAHLPWKKAVERSEFMLGKLLAVVESVGFLGHASLTGSTTIFNMATEVIENYWEMINQGLAVVQQWYIQGLDNWMESD